MTNDTTGALSVIEDALKEVGKSRDMGTYIRAMDKCEKALALCKAIRDEVPEMPEYDDYQYHETYLFPDDYKSQACKAAELLQKICEVSDDL